jgi:hypothetical protein
MGISWCRCATRSTGRSERPVRSELEPVTDVRRLGEGTVTVAYLTPQY